MIDLSIITVTHQSMHQIETLINSVISGALKSQIEHIIVDNASRDGTVDLIKGSYLSFVTLIENNDNVGFSAANNRGFSLSKGRYVLFLNPDMKVEDGSLDAFVEWMDAHPDVGVAGCKLIDPMGEWMVHRAPSRLPKWGQSVCWLLSVSTLRDSLEDLSLEQDVDVVLGAFLIARRSVLERLGFAFDPRYFLTFEDADLCREAKRLGYRVVYNPTIRCVDYNSRSFAQKHPLWTYSQVAKGMYVYFRKWGAWYQWALMALCIPIGYAIRFLKNNRQKNLH
jgi:GT2 family glycosyltransferase